MKKIILILAILVVCAGGWFYWQWSRIDIEFEQGREWIGNGSQGEQTIGGEEGAGFSQEKKGNRKEVIEQQVQEELKKKNLEEISTATAAEIEKAIIEKYQAAFFVMKEGYQGEINELIARGKKEYADLPPQDKKTAKLTMALKYVKLGNALEAACDDSFNKVLEQMQRELAEKGLPVNGVKEAKNQYEKEKSERRKNLMDKAMGSK